jgi:hypothetical protein
MQAGLRPRVVAHLVAQHTRSPEDAAERSLALWAWQTLRDLDSVEFVEGATADASERAVLRAAAHARSVA